MLARRDSVPRARPENTKAGSAPRGSCRLSSVWERDARVALVLLGQDVVDPVLDRSLVELRTHAREELDLVDRLGEELTDAEPHPDDARLEIVLRGEED